MSLHEIPMPMPAGFQIIRVMKVALVILIFVLTNAAFFFLFPFSLGRFLVCAAYYASGTLLILYFLFHPRSNFLLPVRSTVHSDGKPCVALTFDDGPNMQHTETLIQLLREKQVKATFFVVGEQVLKYPELSRQLLSEGNGVANHTFSHPPLFCFLSPRRLNREVEKCQEAIIQTCGFRPTHFRSPVGLRHPLLWSCLLRTELQFISWRTRAFDTRVQTPEAIARRILAKVKPGDIILLHDKPGKATQSMLEALPAIIDSLKARGFEFVLI
jgi:peptidoglycan-N-acetylglucosamine deacetylase